MFGLPFFSDLKPEIKNFLLTNITGIVNKNWTKALFIAPLVPSKNLGRGRFTIGPIATYMSIIIKKKDTLSLNLVLSSSDSLSKSFDTDSLFPLTLAL